MDYDFDYIIVGSGFGGSVAALRLSEKGYRVAVIEAGKRYRPQDFAKTNWQTRKFFWSPRLFSYGIFRISLFKHVMVLSGAGVGGGSLVYANTLLQPPASVWQDPAWCELWDWSECLKLHYATAEYMLGVTRNPFLGQADKALQQAAEQQGFGDSFYPTNVAVYFGEPGKTVADPYFGGAGPERTGCTLRGACMIGCRDGGKNTLDKNYLYFAEKNGAQIIPETRVIDVKPLADQADGGAGYAVMTQASTRLFGPQKMYTCKGIIFAAGVLGTLDLLLRAKDSGSLPQLSDQLGQRVRTNAESLISVRKLTGDVDYSEGLAIGSGIYIDEHTHIEAVRYPQGSDALALLSIPMVKGSRPMQRFLHLLGLLLRHPWRSLKLFNPIGFAKSTIILLVMQTTDSHISLRLTSRWWWPWRKKLVTSGEKIPSYIPQANQFTEKMAQQLDAVAQSTIADVALNRPITAHILGGAPMGKTAADGVIDKYHRVFNYQNMYICDGSMIGVNLGVNPSLSITAMTEHAMTHIPHKK